jgi:uncharacterized protein (UPF0297 family)
MRFHKLTELRTTITNVIDNLLVDSSLHTIGHAILPLEKIDIFDLDLIYNKLSNSYNQILIENQSIRQILENIIKEIDQTLINEGLTLSNDPVYVSTFTEEFNVITVNDTIIDDLIRTRISIRSNWQYPALYLHCLGANRIDYMIDSDPLYIAEYMIDSMREKIAKYPTVYQNRLRLYSVDKDNFEQLPQAQFGLIFCWEYFNTLDIKRVESYLSNIINLLRPGGTVMFSYSNAELEFTAKLIDDGYCAWASKSYMTTLLTQLGYENLNFIDAVGADSVTCISWVEARKPGTLTTIKRGQAMGEIKTK